VSRAERTSGNATLERVATADDVRRIALALPDVVDDGDGGYRVRRGKGSRLVAWQWRERVDPKAARVPNPDVLVVRVAGLEEKEALLASDPRVFFTEPHYDGYAAVLVRLAEVGDAELAELVTDSWRLGASPRAVRDYDAGQ
jgi:hypothetical protein